MDFITEFHDWVEKGRITDAPRIFIEATALQVLSMTIRRSCWVYWGRKRVFPVLWILLIARSGVLRKSTCLSLCASFLDDDRVLPQEYSSEMLIKLIGFKRQGILLIDEMELAARLWGKEYASSVKGFLTSLFDTDMEYRRETMEYQVKIREPFIGIFGATTPNFRTVIKEEDILMGFIPRFLLLFQSKKEKHYEFPGRGDLEKEAFLRQFLSVLRNEQGELSFTEQAKSEINNYSNFLEGLMYRENLIAPFFIRLQLYNLKLAMLYHLAEYERGDKVTLNSVIKARNFCEEVRKSTEKLIQSLALTPYQEKRQKVIELVETAQVMPYSDLLRKMRIPAKELEMILSSLELEEVIDQVFEPGAGKKPRKIIRLKSGENEKE